MAHIKDLPHPTDPTYAPVWAKAVRTAGKRLQRVPTSQEIIDVYAEELALFTHTDGTIDLTKKAFVLPDIPYRYPNGMILRTFTLADLDVIAPLMVYDTEQQGRAVVNARLDDPFTQMLAWEFRGQLVQTESLTLVADGVVVSGTMVHCMPRTAQFWHEMEKPVWERLLAVGVTHICSPVLTKLIDYWAPILTTRYGATVVRQNETVTTFKYPINLTVFMGMPRPRTVPGWSWSHAASGLVVREMGDAEYDTVMRDIATTWGGEGHPRLPVVRQTLEEQRVLDHATILVAYQDATLVGVFSIRPTRHSDTAHLAALARDRDPQANAAWRVIYRGVCEWALAAGFTKMTSVVPKAIWNNALQLRVLRHARAEILRERRHSVEIVRDLVAIHAEPISAWETWNHNRHLFPAMPDQP